MQIGCQPLDTPKMVSLIQQTQLCYKSDHVRSFREVSRWQKKTQNMIQDQVVTEALALGKPIWLSKSHP